MKMIKEGIGISIMSRGCAMESINGDLVELPIMPGISFDINLVYRRGTKAPAVDLFVKYIRSISAISA